MEIEIEGIVLRQTPYKDKDAMVSCLTEKGIVGFLARGLLSIPSKNAASCLLFSHSKFLLSSRGNNLSLRSGVSVESYYKLYESIETMACLNLMSEILLKVIDVDDGRIYPTFKRVLQLIQEGHRTLDLMVYFLARVILYSGYELNYSTCVNCSRTKGIVHVDYNKGGFVCFRCSENPLEDDKTYLKTFKYVFKVAEDDFAKYQLNTKVAMRLLSEFLDYLKDRFGIKKWNSEEMYLRTI